MIAVREIDLRVVNLRLRLPFRYGITTLTAVPHLIVRARVETSGKSQWGVAADNLAPKWFTKNPAASIEDERADLIRVIRNACDIALRSEPQTTVFGLWRTIYAEQKTWGDAAGHPPLLWNFGVTLIERAVIDAFCRAERTTFHESLMNNRFGIELGQVHEELAGAMPSDLLPPTPSARLAVRHTVGMTDPLDANDISPGEALDDGLPQSLAQNIQEYGLTHFKIKTCGKVDEDRQRLLRVADVIDRHVSDYAFTLDFNENFEDAGAFVDSWKALAADPRLAAFFRRLLFVEQPLRRDIALTDSARAALLAWPQRPPMIIDESDATLAALPRALECGYAGTSHKNCKGIFKGIANACLLEHRRRSDRARVYLLSGEDLTNIGPVALLQDVAVAASLGLTHLERNGHHYLKGISMFPESIQRATVEHHGDLFRRHDRGYATLAIAGGMIETASVIAAPFGTKVEIDPSLLIALDQWNPATLISG